MPEIKQIEYVWYVHVESGLAMHAWGSTFGFFYEDLMSTEFIVVAVEVSSELT